MAEAMDAVIRRVKKLLRLAQSDNPHEAATAAAQAQRLLTLHGLEATEIERADQETIGAGGAIQTGSALEKWRSRLAGGVAEANQCRALVRTTWAGRTRTRVIELYGRPSDVSKASYLFEYYAGEIQRLAATHCVGRGRTWANNFKHGVVDTIGAALIRASRETAVEVSSTALARLDNRQAEVDAWLNVQVPVRRAVDSSVSTDDASARRHGQLAGQLISPNGARAALGGSNA